MPLAAAAIAGLLLGGSAVARADPEVKQSQSGICHGQDSVHYERAAAAAALGPLALLGWLWMRRKPGPGGGPGNPQDDLERRRWEGHRRD